MRQYLILALLVWMSLPTARAAEKFGNYLDTRIGEPNKMDDGRYLYFPGSELMYDFDGTAPTNGLRKQNGSIDTSSRYYISAPASLRWRSSSGAALTFDAKVRLKAVPKHKYAFSVGLFQENVDRKALRTFRIRIFDRNGKAIADRKLWLHRKGWNFAAFPVDIGKEPELSRVEITQTGGPAGELFLDNLLIYHTYMAGFLPSPYIFESEYPLDEQSKYPPNAKLTDAEKEGLRKIRERLMNIKPVWED